jgi:hypothetical protein
LALPGCDVLTAEGPLSGASASDRADTADLLDSVFGCGAEVEPISGSESGALDADDCVINDGSFADFYAFRIEEDADVRVEMDSDDFSPYLLVFRVNSGAGTFTEVGRDPNGSEGDAARVTASLGPGLYVAYANAVRVGQTGDYVLTVEADGSED